MAKEALSSFTTAQEAKVTSLLVGTIKATMNPSKPNNNLPTNNLTNPAIRAINPQIIKAMATIIIQIPDLIFMENLLLLLLTIILPRPLLKFIMLLVVKAISVWEVNLLTMAEEVVTNKEKKLKRLQ